MQIKQQGQGLIETILVFLLISGSIVALITFQNYLAYSNSLVQQQTTALNLAINQIETLRDFYLLTGTGSYQNIASGSSSSTASGATFTTTWTITTNTSPNYKVIDVTVSWTDRRNSSQSIRLVSRVAGLDPIYSAAIV